MRCYHLNNFYLGGIHAGIQSAHAQHELMLKYLDPLNEEAKSPYLEPQRAGYLEWARDHKTIIVLNAGMQSNLEDWVEFLIPITHSYAWASFNESVEALNGALTNVALVLPARIYEWAREVTRAVGTLPNNVLGERVVLGRQVGTFYRQATGTGEITFNTGAETIHYTAFDLELMSRLSKCGLM